jgi:hypothetical protein
MQDKLKSTQQKQVIPPVTTQDFIKFWGKFFAFVLLEMIGIPQGFKTF